MSSFAYQFLVLIQDHFLRKKEDEWSKNLSNRITETCEAHRRWISRTVLTGLTDEKPFLGTYWATGKRMEHSGEPRDLVGMALHLIKMKTILDSEIDFLNSGIDLETFNLDFVFQQASFDWEAGNEQYKNWLKVLRTEDKRGHWTFERPSISDIDIAQYHLNDHVWIWNALKTVCDRSSLKYGDIKEEAQRNILKRFSIADTGPAEVTKPLLAARRNIWESSCLLQSRDTALLYKEWSLLYSPSLEAHRNWINTLESQICHIKNEYQQWQDPLKYGLALLLSSQKWQVTSRLRPEEMFNLAIGKLLESCSPNGLFPDHLDDEKDIETSFDEAVRDHYWHTTFELPYLVLQSSLCPWSFRDSQSSSAEENTISSTTTSYGLSKTADQMQDQSDPKAGQHIFMEESTPYQNLMEQQNRIDNRNVIEFADEWLYKCPEFLQYSLKAPLVQEEILDIVDHLGWSRGSVLSKISGDIQSLSSPSGGTGCVGIIVNMARSSDDALVFKEKAKRGALTRKKHKEKPFKPIRNRDLLKDLTKWQDEDEHLIRKRFIWLPVADRDTALSCCLATPLSERENLLAFFNCHAKFEKKLLDDTSAALNVWTTEFHLSFYCLHDKSDSQDIPKIPDPGSKVMELKKNKVIRRGAMGFRFNGDFFDRHLICHFVECNRKEDHELYRTLQRMPDPGILASEAEAEWRTGDVQVSKGAHILRKGEDSLRRLFSDGKGDGKRMKKSWRQRKPLELILQNESQEPWHQQKVLELILFDEMTKQVAECTEEILEMIKGVLMDIKESFKEKSQKSEKSTSPGALGHHSHQLALSDTLSNALFFEEIDSGAYFSFSKQWEELQQLLQILDDGLGDTIDKISSWEVRERDRGLEKPRWTKKDEQRYRPTITRLTGSNRKNTRQIERVQANVQSLRTALLNTRDYIREELSLRGAEDTRYFTYVTVIFLPLGSQPVYSAQVVLLKVLRQFGWLLQQSLLFF